MTQHWWYKGTISQQLCAGMSELWPAGLSALKDTQTDKWVIMLNFSPLCQQVTDNGCERVLHLSDQWQLKSSWHVGVDQWVSTDEPHQDRNVVYR